MVVYPGVSVWVAQKVGYSLSKEYDFYSDRILTARTVAKLVEIDEILNIIL